MNGTLPKEPETARIQTCGFEFNQRYLHGERVAEPDFFEENCENCAFLAADDTCGNSQSVYHLRPTVYRDGDAVLQTAWCEQWAPRPQNV